MRLVTTLALLVLLAPPAMAVVVHDESVDGDLSTNPASPTPISFVGMSSVINGTTGNPGTGVDRDYITFTIPVDRIVNEIRLLGWSPDNLGFLALNAGSTSFVPGAGTSASFLAGIHVSAAEVGSNLLPLFVSSSVTTNSLPEPFLGAGTYCFLAQQTSLISQSYSFEFIVDFILPTHADSWGAIKALYRTTP